MTMNYNNKIIIINMEMYISYRKSTAMLKMLPVLAYMNNSLRNKFIKKNKVFALLTLCKQSLGISVFVFRSLVTKLIDAC